jgi:hypothetical protein
LWETCRIGILTGLLVVVLLRSAVCERLLAHIQPSVQSTTHVVSDHVSIFCLANAAARVCSPLLLSTALQSADRPRQRLHIWLQCHLSSSQLIDQHAKPLRGGGGRPPLRKRGQLVATPPAISDYCICYLFITWGGGGGGAHKRLLSLILSSMQTPPHVSTSCHRGGGHSCLPTFM